MAEEPTSNPEEQSPGFLISILSVACFLLAGASCVSIQSLGLADAVEIPKHQPLELKGVPGDWIRLHATSDDTGEASGDLSVKFEDAETGAYVTTGKVELTQHAQKVFARFEVPFVPERDAANLIGTLYGPISFGEARSKSIEIPFSLQVRPRGEVQTSGSGEAPLERDLASLLGVLAFVLVIFAPGVVYMFVESRRIARDAAQQSTR